VWYDEGYHHRQRVCQPFRLKNISSRLEITSRHLVHVGFKPEGLAHPLPGAKAPEMAKNEVERPGRADIPTSRFIYN
jgi:hypothetical protein